jgi:hypothetical protein
VLTVDLNENFGTSGFGLLKKNSKKFPLDGAQRRKALHVDGDGEDFTFYSHRLKKKILGS